MSYCLFYKYEMNNRRRGRQTTFEDIDGFFAHLRRIRMQHNQKEQAVRRISWFWIISFVFTSVSACSGNDHSLADGDLMEFTRRQDGWQCIPNNDGVIEASEISLQPNVTVNYRINPPGTLVAVDLAGHQTTDGIEWNFSSMQGQIAQVKTESIEKKWFAAHFPTATFAVGTDAKAEALQVLHVAPKEVQLLGIASQKPDETLLIYDKPVTILKFPLRVGQSFVSHGTVSDGKFNHLPVATQDTYEVSVDTEGALILQAVRLSRSLRIRIVVTSKTLGGKSVVTRQAQWYHECYGEVARIISQANETAADFSQAVEFRRLSF